MTASLDTHSNPFRQLAKHGQSVWYDNLSRQLLRSGGLRKLMDDAAVVGVTSNPTIFDKAISDSDAYDDQLRELVASGRTVDEMFDALAIRDIQSAADILRPIFDDANREPGDGFVSLEVSPTLAHDTERTKRDALRLFERVDRPNVMIKIPGTVEGIPAIEQMLYEGVNINITLLFGLEAYANVADAYLRALERRLADGKPIDTIASVASFFVSRVDTEADKRLQAIIDAEPGTSRAALASTLLGKLAVANAKLAYLKFKDVFSSPRFERLAQHGARVQRPLWASTSTKNPAYADTLYVDELLGPHTIQTLAQASIDAFGDHGVVDGNTVEEDIDGARAVFDGFAELGISYDDITDTLVREGVASFAKSFESLLNGLRAKSATFRDDLQRARDVQLGALSSAVRAALEELDAQDAPRRLQARDATLWGGDSERQTSVAQRLGWLPVVERMLAEAREGQFERLAQETQARGYQHAVLLGMGGSSLAPEVFSLVYADQRRDGFPRLTVLDTTHPDTIARTTAELRGQKTLFIVSTKSGTTVETMSLCHYFLAQPGVEPGDFIAITDPGTPLESEARERGFWKIFLNPADIGGRYSALSYFGLVALAVSGGDVEQLLLRAADLLPVHDSSHPGVWLGAVMAAAQRAGRDKLTLVGSQRWAPLSDWLEQLIAESTGKQGVGIIPVTHESLGEPSAYGADRLFVALLDADDRERTSRLRALRDAGHPVVELILDCPAALGAEFVRWEIATAVAGGLLGINPFDESNVQEAKDATNAVLRGSTPAAVEHSAPSDAVRALCAAAKPNGYLALLAYVDRTPANLAALAELREALRARSRLATTLGVGPRYLHSTGQLHKGGPSKGVFLEIVEQPATDLEIPGANFTFAQLFAAQSVGDAQTLRKHGLTCLRVESGGDLAHTLRALTVEAAAPSAVSAGDQ